MTLVGPWRLGRGCYFELYAIFYEHEGTCYIQLEFEYKMTDHVMLCILNCWR